MTAMGKFYTMQDAADILGIHVRTIQRMIKQNELRAYKVARCVRIREEDLQEYLDNNVVVPAESQKTERIKYQPGFRLV